ncbi:MAG: sugar ABC transporter permease [Dokdonella sp.]
MSTPSRTGWLFAAPALTIISAFFALPVLAALVLSVTDFDLYALSDSRNLRFVGFGNYTDLLQMPMFWKSLGNTFYFVLVGVPLSIAVSLAAALLLDSKLARFKGFFRTALFAPVVTTIVAVAVIWRYFFHTRYGLVNYTLGFVGIEPIDWLGDPNWSMPTIILFAVWKNFGYNMIILLAGLQAIPQDLYEAARIDGASFWKQLRHITLPLLKPTLLLVAIITTSGYFQLFAEPYVMTRGGPLQSTTSVLYFMFEEGFKWWNLGRASAVAFLLFVLILGVTALMLRLGRSEDDAVKVTTKAVPAAGPRP